MLLFFFFNAADLHIVLFVYTDRRHKVRAVLKMPQNKQQ